jgi:hypothetical protein
MLESIQRHKTDLQYLTTILALAAIPVVALRALPTPDGWWRPTVSMVSFSAIFVVVWNWRKAAASLESETAARVAATTPWNSARLALLAILFLGLTVVNFYLPLCQHFWGGGDEHIVFLPRNEALWNSNLEQNAGRPLSTLPVLFAEFLTPDRIEGFLLVGAALVLANSLLMVAILSHFFRDDWLVPLLGGVLYLINPCDLARFYVIWAANNYCFAVFCGLLATWLFLESGARGSRLMLVGACGALLLLGLCHEGLLPLECLVPGLLWLSGRAKGRLLPWMYAWYGVVAISITRFAIHLCIDPSYQAGLLGSADLGFKALYKNFITHLEPVRQYYAPSGPMRWPLKGPFWVPGLIATVGFCTLCAVASWRRSASASPRRTLLGVGLGCVAMQCGLLPFFFIWHNFRTQFFAAPGVAALLACVVGSIVAFVPGRTRTCAGMVLAGWMVATTTVAAWTMQRRAQTTAAATFAKAIDVFDQVRSLSPKFVPGTYCVFLVNADSESPMGDLYSLECTSMYLLDGAVGMQATVVDPPPAGESLTKGGTVAFLPAGVQVRRRRTTRAEYFGYDKLILYRLSWTGEVTLLEKFPAELLPPGTAHVAYDPLPRMLPGPITPARFYRYPAWIVPPEDVVNYRDGFYLGEDWGELRFHDGQLSRWARDGAEILVNPAGQNERNLEFRLNLAETSTPGVLQALDDAGRVVATATQSNAPGQSGIVVLALPLDTTRINRFHLRLSSNGARSNRFEIARVGPDVPPNTKYAGANRIRWNICGNELMLQRGWHGLEGVPDGNPFRWVANDAVLAPKSAGEAGTLLLELEPGPGMGGRTGEFTVADSAGKILARQTLAGHQRLRVPVPANLPGKQDLVLHITNGGTPIPTDPRILNFRVFRAELLPDATANASRELR